MAVIEKRLYADYWAPDGTLRLQDIGYFYSGNTSTNPRAAKTDGNNNHYVLWDDGTNLYLNVARENTPVSQGGTFTRVSSSAQTLISVKGMAKDDNNDLIFIDYSSDDVYRLTHTLENVHAINNVGVMDGSATPYAGMCFCEGSYVVCGLTGAGNYRVEHVRGVDGGTWQAMAGIVTRQTLPTLAVAWNGRDFLVLTPTGTALPYTGYSLYLYRPAPSSSGGPGYTFGTRTTFTGFDAGTGVSPVDVDWDGRNWVVYFGVGVDIGA